MGTEVIKARDNEADAVGPSLVKLDATLHFITEVAHQSLEPDRRVVIVARRQALLTHPTAQTLGVCGQTGNRHSHVIVKDHDFLLVGRQLGGGSFQRDNHGVRFAFQAHSG